jgi:hypothetical protein
VLKIVGIALCMAACGLAAFLGAIAFLMNLGLKRHGNYEHYGSPPFVALIYLAGALGFLAPAVLYWRLRGQAWRFSVAEALIALTAAALLLGLIAVCT